ncbi:hypothetical protein SAMN06295998_1314 [Primorskyibacter flagellatus]|uniref:Uncharacterized protein n=1 Tax=Primorskyibacter flagellatus TaxID=1387277 RepID=A0A1W2EKX0_9RHOB|nr:hypothetical protein SAMN06295998_1314 [Primorskyibacter flagellatus]
MWKRHSGLKAIEERREILVIWGMRQVGGLPSGSFIVWALESAMTRCFGS